MEVTNRAVMEALDGLPPVKVHCSLLAEEAIHAALWDYAQKNQIIIWGLVKPKSDSQEICFIPDHDYAKFIQDRTDHVLAEGNFVDRDGKVIGRHKGITHYTIGQRKGLNLSVPTPVFVIEI